MLSNTTFLWVCDFTKDDELWKSKAETDQALDNLEQFFNDDGNALIAKQLCHNAEMRSTNEARVHGVDDVVAITQTLSHTTQSTTLLLQLLQLATLVQTVSHTTQSTTLLLQLLQLATLVQTLSHTTQLQHSITLNIKVIQLKNKKISPVWDWQSPPNAAAT